MRFKTTACRNRNIFAEFKAGQNAESLGKQYRLTVDRVRAILTAEGNKFKFSPDPFYRALRTAQRPNWGAAAVRSILEGSP
jgi:hypothetical protein